MPHERRRIVLDEDISWKLSLELRKRGLRDATSNRDLELLGTKDGELIKILAEGHEPCVLVAWDNKMVTSHADQLCHFGLTLAVIDRRAQRGDLTDTEYYREVIHRWAHRIALQPGGSVMKYSRSRRKVIAVMSAALAAP